jgi:hypothetical protein
MRNVLPRSRRRLAAALASAAVAGAALAACDTSSPITFRSSHVTSAGIADLGVHRGHAVSYAAFLASKPAGYSYQVTEARLIPLPGFRTPHLLGTVFLRTRGVPLQARGYPPLQSNGTRYPVHALDGYTARSGAEPFKPQLVLMYGLRGDHLGGYAVAGIKITYRIGQRSYTADIYDGAVLFNYPKHETRAEHQRDKARYLRFDDKAVAAMQKLINV